MLSKAKLAEIRALHQKKKREESGLFIAEGLKTVMDILREKPELISELLALPEFIQANGKLLAALKLQVTELNTTELRRLSLQENPNQVLAVCRKKQAGDLLFDFKSNFTYFLDDIRDPGNFGTILRLAAWFGIKKIFCTPSSCELYNPKVIQASMGAFLRIDVVFCSLEELRVQTTLPVIYGAVLNGKNIYREKLKNGLILIGNEANGLSRELLEKIDHPLTIPKGSTNDTESLNAAVAAGIIGSEFFRQLHHN